MSNVGLIKKFEILIKKSIKDVGGSKQNLPLSAPGGFSEHYKAYDNPI